MKHLNLFVLTMMLLMCLPSANAQNNQTKKNAQDSVSSKIWDGDYGEIMPQFPGGDKALKEFIQKNLRYPTEAMKKGIQGRVIVTFNVETDGSITDAKVVKAVDSLLNNEALRIVKSMPKWQPGGMMSKGKTVLTKYKYTIPVIFKLDVETRPSFPGGYKALQEFIEKEKKYPDEALKKREEGAVYVVFTVDTLGNVVHPKVATSVSPSLDREALRIVRKMPKWIPGREGNKKINMDFTVIIRFSAPRDPGEPIFMLDCGLAEELEAPADTSKIYDVVDTMPSFQGDLTTYLYNETRYPAIAEGTGAEGRAIVTFVVERDGSISRVKVVKSLAADFAIKITDYMTAEYRQKAKAYNKALQAMDKEAARVIKSMPKWNPGKYHDEVVRVKFTLAVSFLH